MTALVAAALAVAVVIWLFVSGVDDDTDAGPTGPTSTMTTPGGSPSETGSSTPSPTGSTTSPTSGPATSPTGVPPVRATFGEDVDLGNGVTVDIVDIEAVEGKGGRPGEVGGPSVRFTVQVSNESGKALDLDNAVVNAYFGPDERPATQLQRPGGIALPQSLADGKTAIGKYLFNIPLDERDQVTVEFVYTAEAPMIIYTGAARG